VTFLIWFLGTKYHLQLCINYKKDKLFEQNFLLNFWNTFSVISMRNREGTSTIKKNCTRKLSKC